jgi:anti-anti-sigma factor
MDVGAGRDAPRFACSAHSGALSSTWVRVRGEVDIATSTQMRREVREATAKARLVVLDLREVSFIDSAGVHAILDSAAACRARGQRLLVVRGGAQVTRMFELTGVASQVILLDLAPAGPPRSAAAGPPGAAGDVAG